MLYTKGINNKDSKRRFTMPANVIFISNQRLRGLENFYRTIEINERRGINRIRLTRIVNFKIFLILTQEILFMETDNAVIWDKITTMLDTFLVTNVDDILAVDYDGCTELEYLIGGVHGILITLHERYPGYVINDFTDSLIRLRSIKDGIIAV